jgi:hydroxysqualene synthase
MDKRPFVWSIYAFARIADDYADEGVSPAKVRLEKLEEWERQLHGCYEGEANHPVFVALAETVRRCHIPQQLLVDLLTAFKMDVVQNRFGTFHDLLHYCRHSANPIGRLVLHIFDNATQRMTGLSDDICTALQLANFWQDVALDWQKGRLYLPLEDIDRFGYTERDLEYRIVDDRFRKLMVFEVGRTRKLFEKGRPLLVEASRELRTELNLTWRGGMRILKKIERLEFDVLHRRPTLSAWDKAAILGASILRFS